MSETSTKPPGRSRGRPRDPGLRVRILEAAQAEFLDEGLDGARVERIASRAGTSKMTLYQYFASKTALFQEVRNSLLIGGLPQAEQFAEDAGPKEVLLVVAKHYLKAITAPATIQQIHLLCQPHARDRPAAMAFLNSGPEAAVRQVASLLQRYCDQGVLAIPSPAMAAEQFLAMVRGNEHMRALLSLQPGRDERALDTYLSSCVDLLLRSFPPASSGDPDDYE